MTRRTALKWLHWIAFGLMAYFFFVEPENVRQLGGAALATHAGMGTILAIVVALWMTMYLRKGLASRAGPKLPGWARATHGVMHRAMMWGSFAVVLSGALAGFAAPYAIALFGVIPLFPGRGGKGVHDTLTELHELTFDVMLIGIAVHVVFHLWRHYAVRDNALRIMAPKVLHKYL
ncbi:cytochrome b/b6 domain-containing protein [uncultured Tateyamaria sp.]|uniref:cytochrome b/b6 domain-containing protein n=1 Tax=Tateyamaria sp. 1078 TaxID=3417464 RepID=UPI0026396471|nr:cytochrome b/b6 domain-containing protein [uncultured Tateyamaria sp.]